MEEKCPERGNSKTEQFIPKNKNHVVIATIQPEEQPLKNSNENVSKGQKQPRWVHVWPQVLASCIALSTTIQAGINLAYSSILLPQLENDPDICNFTDVEASWVASLVAGGTPIGALIVGPVMDIFGRKTTCILSNIPILLSWILIYTTKKTIWPLYVARALAGFGAGMSTVALVYTAEIAHSLYRPMLLCLNSVFVAFGIMMTNVLGAYLSWRTLALLFGLLYVFSFSLCLVLPESPNWLITFKSSDKKVSQALEELQKLNRPTWLYQEECRKLKEIISERRKVTEPQRDRSNFLVRLWKKRGDLIEMSVFSPMLILLVLFLLQQLTGVYVIIFYSVSIFEKIIRTDIDKYTGGILLGVLRFVMSIVTAALSRVYGRRPLMIVSSLGMTVSCGLAAAILSIDGGGKLYDLGSTNLSSVHFNEAAYGTLNYTVNGTNFDDFNSTSDRFDSSNITVSISTGEPVYNAVTIVTVGLILLFVCFGAVGHLVIPWTLISELLPTKARAIGSGLVISYAYLLMFLTVKTFLPILDAVGLSNVLFFYAIISLLSALFTHFYIPETLGKTFKEISKSFRRTNR